MNATTTIPRPRGRGMWMAMLLYASTTAVSLWLGAPRPVTLGSALASSAATAAGTLAMAFYLVRWTPYPRWGFLGAAAVLALGALTGPLVSPSPGAWADGARSMLWMDPWYVIVLGLARPTARPRWCAPAAPWSGALLIGTAALLTLISWVATWI